VSGRLSPGAIAGVVLGVVALCLMIAVVILWMRRRKPPPQDKNELVNSLIEMIEKNDDPNDESFIALLTVLGDLQARPQVPDTAQQPHRPVNVQDVLNQLEPQLNTTQIQEHFGAALQCPIDWEILHNPVSVSSDSGCSKSCNLMIENFDARADDKCN
jgi:hypothetical protein